MRILVVTGTSGGHLFPAIGFLDTLKDKYKDVKTLLVLPLQCRLLRQSLLKEHKVCYISVLNIKLRPYVNFFFTILNFSKSFFESIFIFLNFQPDIVVGFGTISSVPIVLLAWVFRINTLIHEQNVILGRANRFLARVSNRIAISFEETKVYLKNYSGKIVLTGNPLRKELVRIDKNKALDFFGFSSDNFTILIVGGSQASRSINSAFLRAATALFNKYNFQLIHLAGERDCDLLNSSYKKLGIDARIFSFLNSMQYAYSACDLVVSRAGATAISELIFFGLPAILIPYPYAYKHQFSNAKVLEERGSAVIINDDELGGNKLTQVIESLFESPAKLNHLRLCYNNTVRLTASELLASEVMSLNYRASQKCRP